MANPATADVIIVGAGIMGVSTAYHLARRRAGRIVVLERDDVCSGSTALASGGIRHQYANRIGIELTLRAIETYERFEEEFGVNPRFRQHGYLILVTTEAEQAQAERNVALQQSLGVDVRLLSPDETRRRFPYLATDDLRGATYSPRDGYADPYLATTAIAARARALGVTIRTGCEAMLALEPATLVDITRQFDFLPILSAQRIENERGERARLLEVISAPASPASQRPIADSEVLKNYKGVIVFVIDFTMAAWGRTSSRRARRYGGSSPACGIRRSGTIFVLESSLIAMPCRATQPSRSSPGR